MKEIFGDLKVQDLDELIKSASWNKDIFQSYLKLRRITRDIVEAVHPFIDVADSPSAAQ
jgi:hypothetical protein